MSKTALRGIVIGVLVLAIIIVIAAIFMRPHAPLPKQVAIDTANQPTLGDKNAKVHIVAFEDLKCFNCGRYNRTLYPKIKKKYIDTGVAKYTVINLAFIPGSLPAANAARCLYNQNKDFFFPFVKYVYNHQPSETTNWATIPKLMQFASHIKGVDKQKLSQCMLNSPNTQFIKNNFKMALKLMGGTVATPTIYINGRKASPLTMKRVAVLVKAAQK